MGSDLKYKVKISELTDVNIDENTIPNGTILVWNSTTKEFLQGSYGTGTPLNDIWRPSIDISGNLSWTLSNNPTTPLTVSVQGPMGNPGTNGTNALSSETFSVSAAKSKNVTNSYLEGYAGLTTNIVPFIVPADCKLKYISGTSRQGGWTAELRNNNTSAIIAQLNITSSSYTELTIPIDVLAGTALSIYCNGSNILDPRVDFIFIK
jgi:hypothetical protein